MPRAHGLISTTKNRSENCFVCDTLLLRMILGDLLSAFPHRQFHTLPGFLDSWAALPNSNPNACMPIQGGSLYHFYDGLWYDPAERRTHDLPCERRTCYQLSQPDTVLSIGRQKQLINSSKRIHFKIQ